MHAIFASSLAANFHFAVFLLIAGFGFVLGFFTVRGSGINNHPSDGRCAAPGARLPDEFHQFAGRQIHDADMRRAARARRIASPAPETWAAPQVELDPGAPVAVTPGDEMTLDDVNRRLAADAAARAAAKREQDAAGRTAPTP